VQHEHGRPEYRHDNASCLQNYLSQVCDAPDVEMHSAAKRGTAHKFVENDRYHSSLLGKETRDDACFAAGMMGRTGGSRSHLSVAGLRKPIYKRCEPTENPDEPS